MLTALYTILYFVLRIRNQPMDLPAGHTTIVNLMRLQSHIRPPSRPLTEKLAFILALRSSSDHVSSLTKGYVQ